MYTINQYGEMLSDEGRVAAFVHSIRANVRSGAVVLDVGAATGFMTLVACRCGAKRVYAIEPSEAIHVAEQAVKDNGFADRVVFHQRLSSRTFLPERADILISDLRGSTPCFGTHLTDLIDARHRLLSPTGIILCQSDLLQIALAEIPKSRTRLVQPWEGAPWGLDLRSALRYAFNQLIRFKFKPSELLSEAQTWARIDYQTLESASIHGQAMLEMTREGVVDGFAIWFDAVLAGGASFSNAPSEPRHVYGQTWLPWRESVHLKAGDQVEATVDAVFTGSGYEWVWSSRVFPVGSQKATFQFKQSTLQGRPLSAKRLARHAVTYLPKLGLERDVDHFLLERLDGKTPQGEVASALRARFPDRFPSATTALARVVATVQRYSEA